MINLSQLRLAYVKFIYADHNNSKSVKKALADCMGRLGTGDIGLNVGAGNTKFTNFRNLDIFPGEHIHYVSKVETIPEVDNFFKVIVTQEVLEHVQDPNKAVNEMYRVLKPNGTLYCQLPFIIGYHPGPTDYWRFTKEGISELLTKAGFKIETIGITVGCASGFYRIAVEFFALLFSLPLPFAYHLFKAFFALVLFPIKWLDYLLSFSKEVDRIPGGYYIIARK
jgi:SAM-dependent methyltransferase